MTENTMPNPVTVNWHPLPAAFTHKAGGLLEGAPEMVKVGYPAGDQSITACSGCLDWSAYVDIIDGIVTVFEWHRFDCDLLPYIRLGACHEPLAPGAYCANCGTYNPNEHES